MFDPSKMTQFARVGDMTLVLGTNGWVSNTPLVLYLNPIEYSCDMLQTSLHYLIHIQQIQFSCCNVSTKTIPLFRRLHATLRSRGYSDERRSYILLRNFFKFLLFYFYSDMWKRCQILCHCFCCFSDIKFGIKLIIAIIIFKKGNVFALCGVKYINIICLFQIFC